MDVELEEDTQVIQSDSCDGVGDIQWQKAPQRDDSTSSTVETLPHAPQDK